MDESPSIPFPNFVTFKYNDFSGIEEIKTDTTKGVLKFYAAGNGLQPYVETEPELTEGEMDAYDALLEAWRAKYDEWLTTDRPEGPRPCGHLQRQIFHHIKFVAKLETYSVVNPRHSPFEILPTVIMVNDDNTLGSWKLTYARKRWLLRENDVSKCVEEFNLKSHNNVVSFSHFSCGPTKHLPLKDMLPSPVWSTGFLVATKALLEEWTTKTQEEINKFLKDMVNDAVTLGETYCITDVLPVPATPRELDIKSAMINIYHHCNAHPDLWSEKGLQMPRFINELSPFYGTLKQASFNGNFSIPVYIDSATDRKFFTLWKTEIVPHEYVQALGIDFILDALNPPGLFTYPPTRA